MKKFTIRILTILLAVSLLAGCAPQKQEAKQYQATFLTLFDTVTTILGRDESEEAFQAKAQAVHDELLEYHQLFDIYHDYEGMNNLKTVNDNAGIQPVAVDGRIIELLKDCQKYYDLTEQRVNVAMGSVLSLWHDTRTEGMDDPAHARLPEEAALQQASSHMSMDNLVIDEAAGTVFITDPEASLDVGSVAKGWSVEKVAANAPAGLLISVGGNVRATGPKDADGTPWVIGIQNPDGDNFLHTIFVSGGSVVTSGDYQRTYVVDGVSYHHIIDPDTLFPSRLWRSVTIVCPDSGLADALSTALFLLPREEGQKILDSCHAMAMWVAPDGEIFCSPGFEELIRT